MYCSVDQNLAAAIFSRALTAPTQEALIFARKPRQSAPGHSSDDEVITYSELIDEVKCAMGALALSGIGPGSRVVLLVPISRKLYVLAIALIASGITCTFVDPQMGARQLVRAIAIAKPRAVISLRKLLVAWPLLRPFSGSAEPPLRIACDGAAPGVVSLSRWLSHVPVSVSGRMAPIPRAPDQEALMTFTSGTSGNPKGADRNHGILLAQQRALSAHLQFPPTTRDMPCFPVVALHHLCNGHTAILPPIDLAAPAKANAAAVIDAIARLNVTSLSGAPAYLRALTAHILKSNAPVKSVARVVAGGAPVSNRLLADLVRAFPEAKIEVLYGSTEAEPIAGISATEVLTTVTSKNAFSAEQRGYLVGDVDPAAEVELVNLPKYAGQFQLDDNGVAPFRVKPGAVGELIVRGGHVIRRYVGNPAASHATKLYAIDGSVWHRTGDLAKRDENGRIWLVGRTGDLVKHRGKTLFPLEIEQLLNALSEIMQVALVSDKTGRSCTVFVEAAPNVSPLQAKIAVRKALIAIGLDGVAVRSLAAIPVDRRHQSKIDRALLRRLLAKSGGKRIHA